MPIYEPYQDEYSTQILTKILILAIQNELESLSAETLKKKVMTAYHRELFGALIPFFENNTANPLLLKEVLANQWKKYKGTVCGYTAQPDSEVTVLLCGIVKYLSKVLGEKPIDLLMPGVSTESIVDGMPSLDEMDLKAVLKTHILSESGNYLYPVSILNSLQCESDVISQQIPNPYYDYNLGPENEAYIPAQALERMLNHSTHTQAILDTKARFQSLIKPTNLLGQLQLLIKTLRINSVAGIGSESQAGSRAYAGIISFNEYYQTLNEEQKQAIPKEVKAEIDLLINLSSNKEQNILGTENTQTCINTRQADLALETKKHEQTLINIGVDEQTQSEMIANARASFELSQKQLVAQRFEDSYQGVDKLPLSKQLVDALNVPIVLTSKEDLQDFISLGVSDIESLLENNEPLQDQLVQKLVTLEELIIFTSQTPIEQMEMILHFIANKLPHPTGREFSVWLEMLDLKRSKIVFNAFKDRVIKTSINFRKTLKHLGVEKRDMISKEYLNQLPILIRSAYDVSIVLRYLNVEHCCAVLEAIKERLPTLIKTSADAGYAMALLQLENRAAVFEAIKDRLPSLIQSTQDVNTLFMYLGVEQRAMVYEGIKVKLPCWIETVNDLCNALRFLEVEQHDELFKTIKHNLPKLVRTAGDVDLMFRYLRNEQVTVMLDAIKNKLPLLIKTSENVYQVLNARSDKQCEVLLEAMKDHLATLIKSTYDVNKIFKLLSAERRAVLFEAIKHRVPSLIKSANDISVLLEYFSDQQITVVFEAINDRLPSLMKTTHDIGAVLFFVNDEQQLARVLGAIKHKLSILVKTANDVALICVNVEQCKAVIKALPSVIKNVKDIGVVLKNLGKKPRLTLLEALKERIPSLIHREHDISLMFKYLSIDECKVVLEAIKDQLPRLFKAAENVDDIHLDLDKRAAVLAALNNQAEIEDNPPAFLPNHKRVIDTNEPAKRQRIGRHEMDFLQQNDALEQPRERKRLENDAKRQRICP